MNAITSLQTGERVSMVSDDLLSAHPLPEGVGDVDLNKGKLAQALNTSETTIDKWLREPDFPVLEGGSNGVAYRFRLSHVWAWRQNRIAERKRQADTEDEAVRQMRLHLLAAGEDDQERALGPREREAEYAAEAKYLAAARARREMVPTADVIEMLERIFGIVVNGLEAQPDRAERELGLERDQVAKLISLNDDLIEGINRMIAGAYFQQSGTDKLV